MPVRTEFNEKQPSYRYMQLGNGQADVFIYKFVEEKINEEDGSTSFIYELNEFRISVKDITEEMVKSDPLSYLHYSDSTEEITLEERINAIEEAILELGDVMYD